MITVDNLREFLYLSKDSYQADVAEGLISAATSYMQNAGVTEPENATGDEMSLYNLALKLLAGHWYQNRSAAAFNAQMEIPFGVQSIIHQLTDWRKPCETSET